MSRSEPPPVISLKQVAHAASVSLASASLALRPGKRSPFISETTRARVRQIADDLGYRVNPSARSLRSSRRYSIAIVCGVLGDPSALLATESIIAELNESDYSAVITTCGLPRKLKQYVLTNLDSRSHDAVIFIRDDRFITPELLLDLRKQGIRVAAIMPSAKRFAKMPLAYNNRPRAAEMMVEILAEAGHRRMDYVHPENLPAELLQVIRQKAAEVGARVHLIPCPFAHHSAENFRTGLQLAKSKLAKSPATAVAVFTENMAASIIQGFLIAGIAVPGEKSVLAYGARSLMELSAPIISSVGHSIEIMGRSIARQTLDWIEADFAPEAVTQRQFEPEFYPGETLQNV